VLDVGPISDILLTKGGFTIWEIRNSEIVAKLKAFSYAWRPNKCQTVVPFLCTLNISSVDTQRRAFSLQQLNFVTVGERGQLAEWSSEHRAQPGLVWPGPSLHAAVQCS